MNKITYMYTEPQALRLTVDGEEGSITNIKDLIEKMSKLTGVSPAEIEHLVNKYDQKCNKNYDFKTEKDLKEYILEEVQKKK